MTATPKRFYIPVPDKAAYVRIQEQAMKRRKGGQSLYDIGHDLKIHPVTLRKMLGLPTGTTGRPQVPNIPSINYEAGEWRWKENWRYGRLCFRDAPTNDRCGRAPIPQTFVPGRGA